MTTRALELAASELGLLVVSATGVDAVRLEVWDTLRLERIGRFECALSLFGGRLTVADTPDGPLVVAAAWGVPGIRGHHPATGEVRWERRDLVRSGPIHAGAGMVGVSFAEGPAQVLDASDGRTIARLRGVRDVWFSRHCTVALAARTGSVELLDAAVWERRWRRPIDGFAVMATAFSPDSVLIAEAVDGDVDPSTPLVCRSLDGYERWRTRTPRDRSAPWMTWHPDRQEWAVIEYDLGGGILHRRNDVLVRFRDDGEVLSRVDLGPHGEYAIALAAERVVAADGAVRDLRDGVVVGRLAFGG